MSLHTNAKVGLAGACADAATAGSNPAAPTRQGAARDRFGTTVGCRMVLTLTRDQILGFRRRAGALDERLPPGAESLRRGGLGGVGGSTSPAAPLSISA